MVPESSGLMFSSAQKKHVKKKKRRRKGTANKIWKILKSVYVTVYAVMFLHAEQAALSVDR